MHNCSSVLVRDWSLITRRGGYKMGKSEVWNFLRPPQDRVKLFAPPTFIEWKLFAPPPPFSMAKISSYRLKTTPILFVAPPPSAWLKLPPPLLRRGKPSHAPPSRFVPPPPRN